MDLKYIFSLSNMLYMFTIDIKFVYATCSITEVQDHAGNGLICKYLDLSRNTLCPGLD